jgi:RNA polymerase sigma-70 factor (ECF subfamily)
MAAPAPNPDLLLARRAAAGHAAAWDDLVERYGNRLFNLAYQFAGDGAEADDLTQEMFVKLYESLGRYRGDVPLAAWALALSRNLCIDHYRRNRRERRSTVLSEEVLAQQPASEDPHADAQRRLRLRSVYRALDEMSEEMAMVVLLRDLQGLSYEETAAALELPLGTVKSRLNRARSELVERVRAASEPIGAAGEAVAAEAGSC